MHADEGLQAPIAGGPKVDAGKIQNDKHLTDLVSQVVLALHGLEEQATCKSKGITLQGIELPVGVPTNDTYKTINSWPGFSNPKAIGITCLPRFVGDEAVISVDLLSAKQSGWGKKSAVNELDPKEIVKLLAATAPNLEIVTMGKPTSMGVAHKEYASLSLELREKKQDTEATLPPVQP